ncbi:MAG: hypothetical protein LC136_15445 [Burkholderiales bacterium]|nr:hypothetical protein [Burkholderiales bacterium]
MVPRFDGFVCIDRTKRNFGFLVFREEPGEPVVLECSTWCWPATEEGRVAARQQMVRVIDRLQAESAHSGMRSLRAA